MTNMTPVACPFCGCAPKLFSYRNSDQVICCSLGCDKWPEVTLHHGTRSPSRIDEAVAIWNRRYGR